MTLTSSGSPGAASGRIGGASPAHPNGRESLVARLDWVLLAAVAGLGIIGSALVWSATRPRLLDAGLDPEQLLRRHLLNIAIGVVLGTAVALFDHRMLRAYAPVIYALSIVGLVAVLSPLGSTINGSQSWIVLPGGLSVQPAEFAKVALVIGLAMLLAEKRDTETEPRSGDILLALLFAAVPIGLVMLQPDLGTTVVLGAIVVGMLAVCGAPKKLLAGLAVVGVLVCVAAVRLDVLDDYQIARFTSFTNPGADLAGTGYNANQARIAIGSGGLTGTGLFEGTQTNGKFVPEQQTDFIFTVAGEELGFVGGATVISAAGGRAVARPADRVPGRRPVRHSGGGRGGVLVRVPSLREHRDDARDHAGDRSAAAVHVLRRVVDVRQHDGRRPAPERAPAPLHLTPPTKITVCRAISCRNGRFRSGNGDLVGAATLEGESPTPLM